LTSKLHKNHKYQRFSWKNSLLSSEEIFAKCSGLKSSIGLLARNGFVELFFKVNIKGKSKENEYQKGLGRSKGNQKGKEGKKFEVHKGKVFERKELD